MPTYEVTSPDGKTWEVTAPDGASQEQVLAYAKQQWTAQIKEPPAAVKAGSAVIGVPRQLGLTARYAVEGILPPLVDTLSAPLRVGAAKMGLDIPALQPQVSEGLTKLGFPQPEGANERVVGDMTRMGFGAFGLSGGANKLADMAGTTGKAVLTQLAANPVQQAGAAVGAGGAGGVVREAGGGPMTQAVASVGGAVAGGMGASGAADIGSRVLAALRAKLKPQMTAQQVEQTIQLTLRGSGVDWNAVPERIKQGMRADVQSAMNTGGQLNPDAVRRLLDFRATGVTPTRGMLTQDPVQITREMNLAKVGANSTDVGLQSLPNLQNANTRQLLNVLDDAGARNAPDAYATGERVVGALGGNIAQSKARVTGLYEAARDSQGRSAPLDGAAFTTAANQALDDALLGYAVPQSVATKLNQIAKGEVPFTVDFAEQFKTAMGDIARADKGGATAKAMGVIRKALDATPLRPAPQVNPGNLPAVPGTVPPSPAVVGQESVQAFNRARQANAAMMNRIEGSPALKEVYTAMREGGRVDPDQFVKRFIIGQGASANDVRNLQRAVAGSPEALSSVRQNIVAHLKNAATNNTDDIAKFSSASYRQALDSIGDRKLAAFFSREEIAQLQAVKRTATLMQAQPAGTAVNNSNSGTFLAAKALDALDAIAGKLPLGLDTMIQGVVRGTQQRAALNPAAALIAPRPQNALQNMLGAPAIYGNLLAAQAIDDR